MEIHNYLNSFKTNDLSLILYFLGKVNLYFIIILLILDIDICSICQRRKKKNKTSGDSINHTFCYDCILNWCRINNICPLCKINFC